MAAFLYRLEHPGADDPSCRSKPFRDVPVSSPFCGDIRWLSAQGITGGYADGGFHPTTAVSRQAMAAFLYRLATPGAADSMCLAAPFRDVPTTNAFCGDISWLTGHKITNGYSDGDFRPTAVISRQAMAAFLHRIAGIGLHWEVAPVPLPAKAPAGSSAAIWALSCGGADPVCLAGGAVYATNKSGPAVWQLRNGTWGRPSMLPSPPGNVYSEVDALSCTSDGTCGAVGSGFLWALQAGTWTITKAQAPAGTPADADVATDFVSCGVKGFCVAAGETITQSGTSHAAFWALHDGTWTLTEPPRPAEAPTDSNSSVNAISCDRGGTCAIAGYYFQPTSDGRTPVLWVLDGDTWTASVLPIPSGSPKGTQASVDAVFCGDPDGSCLAGGSYGSSTTSQAALWTLHGDTWTPKRPSRPSKAPSRTLIEISSVSCESDGSCVAGGDYWDAARDDSRDVIWTDNHGTWTVKEAPVFATKTAPYDTVAEISCAPGGPCVAGGQHKLKHRLARDPVLWSLDAGTWTVDAPPVPASTSANNGPGRITVWDVSCGARGTCAAGGFANGAALWTLVRGL